MLRIGNPFPVFLDGQGGLLDNGQIWIGTANQDPEANPIQVYWDAALTIPASQPLRTLAGTIRNGATPAFAFVAADDFSMRVSDSNDAQISYIPSYKAQSTSYQPLDDDLTAIAALGTTAFGRSLLALANVAALQAAIGGLNFIPSSGGTVSGNIVRASGGPHLFHDDASLAGGRVYIRPVGSADPTTNPGDLVFYY